MSQVSHSMRLQLPAAKAALAEIRGLAEQATTGDGAQAEEHRARLDRLSQGREPAQVLTLLEAFVLAVEAGKFSDAIPAWVKVAPILQALGA